MLHRIRRVYKDLNCLGNYRFSVNRGYTKMDKTDIRNYTELSERHQRKVIGLFRRMYNLVHVTWDGPTIEECWPEALAQAAFDYRMMLRMPVYVRFCSDVKQPKRRRDGSPDPDKGGSPAFTKRADHSRKQARPMRLVF